MATVTAFIRVSTKRSEKANIRFRLRDGRKNQLFYKSKLDVNPAHWDKKKQGIKPKYFNENSRAEFDKFDKKVSDLSFLIRQVYNSIIDKATLTSEIFEIEIDKALNPDKYDLIEKQKTFFETFNTFLDSRNISDIRKRNFRVIQRALQRFELYKRLDAPGNFSLNLDSITPDILSEFGKFLSDEHNFFTKDDNDKLICSALYKPIYEAVPESRTPQPRGQNTINDVFTKLRTFFLWANNLGKTDNNPFKNFKVQECVYGTPFYITIEERNQLYHTDLSQRPQLATQRDIFIFQCLIGCRVGDLFKMTKSNRMNGAIEYIPRKTIEGRPITVRVPLNSIAKEILDRYKDFEGPGILPFISEQRYNDAIKDMFLLAGITRIVTVINPTTGKEEKRSINEVASSHLARRSFIGNLYKRVKDPNLVGVLSGHKEGSKAFSRYREIDEDIKNELVKMLE